MKSFLSVTSLILLFFVSGCYPAAVKWERNHTSEEQWFFDKTHCQSRAKHLIEKAIKKGNYSGMEERNAQVKDYSSRMNAFNSKKTYEMYFQACLKNLGYKPT